MVSVIRWSAVLAAMLLLAGCDLPPPQQSLLVMDQRPFRLGGYGPYVPPGYHVEARFVPGYGFSHVVVPNAPMPTYVAPTPVYAAQEPAAPPQPSGGSGWLIPRAEAEPLHPQPTSPPAPSAPPGEVPADNSCGWWRLSNLWCNGHE